MRRTSEPELFRSDGRRSPLRVRLGIETAPAMATAKLGANAESNSECWCSWPKFKLEQRRFQNSPISVAFLLNPIRWRLRPPLPVAVRSVSLISIKLPQARSNYVLGPAHLGYMPWGTVFHIPLPLFLPLGSPARCRCLWSPHGVDFRTDSTAYATRRFRRSDCELRRVRTSAAAPSMHTIRIPSAM